MTPNIDASTAGFANPVEDSQASFRALMEAFAHAARPRSFEPRAPTVGGLSGGALTILLTLADQDTPVWLDAPFAADESLRWFIAFHSGAPIVAEAGQATFAFVASPGRLGDLHRFAGGEPDYPDRSATVIVQAEAFSDGPFVFAGPGIKSSRGFGVSDLDGEFAARWRLNRSQFPLGVDLFFVTDNQVAAIPRSLRLMET